MFVKLGTMKISTSAPIITESMKKYALTSAGVVAIIYIVTTYYCSQQITNYRLQNVIHGNFSYDNTYPLSAPKLLSDRTIYKIAAIADLDTDRSKVPNKPFHWRSYLRTGHLTAFKNGNYKIDFTDEQTLTTTLNEKGRGLELSELCVFNRKLYTVDDRTGVVYQLVNNEPIPWVILQDGNGMNKKGFKCEWMAVRNGYLYVGSIGKEYTTKSGAFLNFNPMFVKRISPGGEVTHLNWTLNYKAIRKWLGIKDPGYVIHEAAAWSNINQQWYFLPRRMSTLRYNDELDEKRGTNVLIKASYDFSRMDVVFIGDLDVTHGFSSFKFVPGTNDNIIIATKSKEVGDEISSYVTIFNANTGRVIMHEVLIANNKYEGIEFL